MGKRWTEEDIVFLQEYYFEEGGKSCAEVLDRKCTAIYDQASKLGIKGNTGNLNHSNCWTEEDIEFLQEYYFAEGGKLCAEVLGRTNDSVRSQARKLGIKGNMSTYLTHEEYLSRVPRDIEVLEKYSGINTKILHKSLKCGHTWKTTPGIIIEGKGCPSCAPCGFNPNIPATLYFIHFPILGLHKVGITKNLKKRFKAFNYESILLTSKTFSIGKDAQDSEKQLLTLFSKHLYNSEELTSGNTETLLLNTEQVEKIKTIIEKGI